MECDLASVSAPPVSTTPVSTIADIIRVWPDRTQFRMDVADDASGLTVTAAQVDKWAQGKPIPAKYHFRIARVAQELGYDLTCEDIARVHCLSQRSTTPAAPSDSEAA